MSEPDPANIGTIEVGKTLSELAKDIVTLTQVSEPEVNNGELLALHDLKVFHVRPNKYYGTHGMTVAYRQINRNVIEIATSVVHPFDTFTKKTGTKLAVEAFIAGRTAFVPIKHQFEKNKVTSTLVYYFGK